MHRLLTAAGALTLALALAAPAFAEGGLTATLASPGATQGEFIAADAVWKCAGADCASGYAPEDSGGLTGCEALVRKVGPVTAFKGSYKALDAKALAKCNSVAKRPATTATASR